MEFGFRSQNLYGEPLSDVVRNSFFRVVDTRVLASVIAYANLSRFLTPQRMLPSVATKIL